MKYTKHLCLLILTHSISSCSIYRFPLSGNAAFDIPIIAAYEINQILSEDKKYEYTSLSCEELIERNVCVIGMGCKCEVSVLDAIDQ